MLERSAGLYGAPGAKITGAARAGIIPAPIIDARLTVFVAGDTAARNIPIDRTTARWKDHPGKKGPRLSVFGARDQNLRTLGRCRHRQLHSVMKLATSRGGHPASARH